MSELPHAAHGHAALNEAVGGLAGNGGHGDTGDGGEERHGGGLGDAELQRLRDVGGQPGEHGVVEPVVAEVRKHEGAGRAVAEEGAEGDGGGDTGRGLGGAEGGAHGGPLRGVGADEGLEGDDPEEAGDAEDVEDGFPAEGVDEGRGEEEAEDGADVEAAEDGGDGAGSLVRGNGLDDDVVHGGGRDAFAEANRCARQAQRGHLHRCRGGGMSH